jgi:transposase
VIGPELTAEVVRLHVVEGWRPGTIGRHLGIHRDTVKAVIRRAGLKVNRSVRRPSKLDRYEAFVKETFERYPKVPASVVWRMITARGYSGSESHFRRWVRQRDLRPRRQAEAFLELRTLPGEQAQVDWASFGTVAVAGGVRRLSAFLMVLSFSRRVFVRFFFDQKMASFLEGHVLAFEHFGGVARTILYDNLKSAVLERLGDAIRFHPTLLEMAAWYSFMPRPVAIARGNEKGRVERAIAFLRSSFFTTAEWGSLEELNRLVLAWCLEVADQRQWPQQRSLGVMNAFAQEQEQLIALPADVFTCNERKPVSIGKYPYAHFDSNRYSVPHKHVDRQLVIEATSQEVRILDGDDPVAEHSRCWDKGQIIEDPEHIDGLVKKKKEARLHRHQLRLLQAVPKAEKLLCELATRQYALAGPVDEFNQLLDVFGAQELQAAVEEALKVGSPHPGTVRLILDRRRRADQQQPPLPVTLPDDKHIRDIHVTPHDLAEYDNVHSNDKEER